MSRAPTCIKTGHVLLLASITFCVPVPCGLQPVGNTSSEKSEHPQEA